MATEMMMVPTSDYDNLINYYKGKITESALLNKAFSSAGRLAAERHVTLKNPRVSDSVALAIARPRAREVQRLTKRLRTGGVTSAPGRGPLDAADDEDDMLKTPLDSKLDKILRNTQRRRDDDWVDAVAAPSIAGKTTSKAKRGVVKKVLKAKHKQGKGGWKKAISRGAIKGIAKQWGVSVSDGDVKKGTTPPQSPPQAAAQSLSTTRRQRRKPKKTTPRAVKALRPAPGWEDFTEGKKARRFLLTRRRTRTKTAWTRQKRRPRQRGGGIDVQIWLGKTGMEFQWPVINSWDPAQISSNDSNGGIRASIVWTRLPRYTTSITAGPRIYRTSGRPIARWSRP